MKVRNKQSGVIIEGSSIKDMGAFFEIPILHSKSEWEEVKEQNQDRWQDVTVECDINDRYELFHRGGLILNPMCVIAIQTYRLRKVQVYHRAQYEWKDGAGKHIPVYESGWAFLVERKVID